MFVDYLWVKQLRKQTIKDKEIADALELPPLKIHCSVLAEGGIRRAIEDWEQKKAHREHNYAKD